MTSGLSAEISCLEDLLGGARSLFIPSYQRPYSWTTAEAGKLLDDINLARVGTAGNDPPEDTIYLATVLLDERAEGDAGFVYDIVDGQQRLVTLTILLCALRDIADDRGLEIAGRIEELVASNWTDDDGPRARITMPGRSGDFFARWVVEPGAIHGLPFSDEIEDCEQRMLDVREHFLSELSGAHSDELEALADYLCKRCVFSVVTTRGIDRAHKIFTHLNHRGRPLARNDILKAHILGGVAPVVREEMTRRWVAIEQGLGDRFEELFSHIRAISGRRRERIIEGIGELVAASGGAEAFIETVLEPHARAFTAIVTGKAATEAGSRRLRYLDWTGSADWVPPVLAWMLEHPDDTIGLEKFLTRFERLAFCLRLLGIGADKRAGRFNAVLAAIGAGGLDASDSPLELTREEARNIAFNLRDVHARSPLVCKLLLLRLNDELAGEPQNLDPQLFTVEHVLPQKPGSTSGWHTLFPDRDERVACTQSIGNLVLVTKRQNERARNMEFERKLAVYFDEKYGPVPYITRELAGLTTWRPQDVRSRQERFLSVIGELWQIDTRRSTVARKAVDGNPDLPTGPRKPRQRATQLND